MKIDNISFDVRKHIQISNLPPKELFQELQAKGWKNVYIDGGKVIQSFLNENLIDELIITLMPILLGQGIALFERLNKEIRLKHCETNVFPSGLVQSRYIMD